MSVSLRFLGTGDAFGTAGRFQTCMLLRDGDEHTLVDCGASSLTAMRRYGVDPDEVGTIVVSHLHGDHFGGIPFLLLDRQFARRRRPLSIAGPAGLEQRIWQTMDCLFPGAAATAWRYPLTFTVLPIDQIVRLGPHELTAHAVRHTAGTAACALRFASSGNVVAYSGDTEWVPALLEVSDGADLFVCEAYTYEKRVPFHLCYADLRTHREAITTKRLVLTHCGPDLFANVARVHDEIADDGLEIRLS